VTRTLFTGDAVGNHDIPVDVPLTVPPRFDFDAASATLKRLRALRPNALAFTHFGVTTDHPQEVIDRYERELASWFDRVRDLRRGRSPDDVVSEILVAPKYATLASPDRFSIEMCVRGALLSLATGD
jgi:glyoxylase-like metal-dependent hydrolase (beta-lactamase superfamily II)